jgi:hypothetical protein
MDNLSLPASKPSTKLKGFKNYQDFLRYSRSLFVLKPAEYQGLYRILLKLQSVGEDPLQFMLSCKNNRDENDCKDLIRFMIYVENLDIEDIQDVA